MFKKNFLYLHGRKKNFTSLESQGQLASAIELTIKSERQMRASRERERKRACERVSELARSLAKNLKSSSSRSLARRKFEVAQLALARSRKFSPIFCTLRYALPDKIQVNNLLLILSARVNVSHRFAAFYSVNNKSITSRPFLTQIFVF